MELTITEYVKTKCPRCGGMRRLSEYQHIKSGLCFACNGTGEGKPKAITREMNDSEVLVALEQRGFAVLFTDDPERTWQALFDPTVREEVERDYRQAMDGARAILKAI